MNMTDLVLLVGTNPLPDYVVARYIMEHAKENLATIWLVYSEKIEGQQQGTLKLAENLEKFLTSNGNNLDIHKIPVEDVSDAQCIDQAIKRRLGEMGDSIHLNYTGGTKTMGIHAYRTLENSGKEPGKCKEFSYLDARSFRLLPDTPIPGLPSDDLRRKIDIDLPTLIQLHGFERRPKKKGGDNFDKAMKELSRLVEEKKIVDYAGSYPRKKVFTDEDLNLLVTISNINKDHIFTGEFANIARTIPDFLTTENKLNVDMGNKKYKHAIKFLDGEWLEKYVYEQLRSCSDFEQHKIYWDWEIWKEEWKQHNLYFQLDVLLLNGYQMCGISCTTSENKGICKGKGCEIILRTRQIGGDEAKSVLVTRLKENKASLQLELQILTGSSDNILVLGEKDLPGDCLCSQIREFLK